MVLTIRSVERKEKGERERDMEGVEDESVSYMEDRENIQTQTVFSSARDIDTRKRGTVCLISQTHRDTQALIHRHISRALNKDWPLSPSPISSSADTLLSRPSFPLTTSE